MNSAMRDSLGFYQAKSAANQGGRMPPGGPSRPYANPEGPAWMGPPTSGIAPQLPTPAEEDREYWRSRALRAEDQARLEAQHAAVPAAAAAAQSAEKPKKKKKAPGTEKPKSKATKISVGAKAKPKKKKAAVKEEVVGRAVAAALQSLGVIKKR